MAELLFNWTLLIAMFGGLFGVAWIGYRDLQSLGERGRSRANAPIRNPIGSRQPAWEHAPESTEETVRPESDPRRQSNPQW